MVSIHPEIQELLKQVEQRYGARIKTSVDFDCLSAEISFVTKQLISSSTLKRMWGYINYKFLPRESTLDVLAKYSGVKDFREFCQSIEVNGDSTSSFISEFKVISRELVLDALVEVCWNPNRYVVFRHMEDSIFTVEESINSKIKTGDKCEIETFMKGQPLFISNIIRGQERFKLFIAGKQEGLRNVRLIR